MLGVRGCVWGKPRSLLPELGMGLLLAPTSALCLQVKDNRILFFQPFVWEDLGLLHIQQEVAQASAEMPALYHCTNNSTSEKQALALYIYFVSCSSFVREPRHLGWLLK